MNRMFMICMVLYVCVAAQSNDFSSSGYAGGAAEYLKLPLHASSAGLGTAVVASRDDLANARYNPAILDALPAGAINVVGTFSILSLDRKHYGADVAGNAGNYFVFGISYAHYGVGNIDKRDDYGDSTGSFDYGANTITTSAAGRITNTISVGMTARLLIEKLYTAHAGGVGFDFGATWLPLPFLSFGLCAQNLGSYLWWSTGTRDQVLPTGRAGICGMLLDKTLLIETDFIKTQKQPEEIAAGIQYFFLNYLYARGGINTAVDVLNQRSKYPDYSIGVGMRYLSLGFDYALLVPDSRSFGSELGLKHMLTLCASIKSY